jgi:hypothetical protein
VIIFMNVCGVITIVMVWLSFVVNGFQLVGNIMTVVILILLKEVFNFCAVCFENSALETKYSYSSVDCYIHVILYNASKHVRMLTLSIVSN